MQAFEFAKALLQELHRQKKAMLNHGGDRTASPVKPVFLRLDLDNISYDDEVQPLREISIDLIIGEGKNEQIKTYSLEVPEGVNLFGPDEIDPWLENVFEFVAKSHHEAIGKAEGEGHKTDTQVFLDKGEWSVTWKTTRGRLSDIPLENAAAILDTQILPGS